MDFTNGWNFFRDDHKKLAWKRVREEAPYLLIGSPPCTYFSVLQELNKAVHGTKPGWQEKFCRETEKAIKHVELFCAFYKFQSPDSERQTLLSRASMGGQILEA